MGVSYSFNCALQAPGLLPRCVPGRTPGPDKPSKAVLAQYTYARYTETAHTTQHPGSEAKQLPARPTGCDVREGRACLRREPRHARQHDRVRAGRHQQLASENRWRVVHPAKVLRGELQAPCMHSKHTNCFGRPQVPLLHTAMQCTSAPGAQSASAALTEARAHSKLTALPSTYPSGSNPSAGPAGCLLCWRTVREPAVLPQVAPAGARARGPRDRRVAVEARPAGRVCYARPAVHLRAADCPPHQPLEAGGAPHPARGPPRPAPSQPAQARRQLLAL